MALTRSIVVKILVHGGMVGCHVHCGVISSRVSKGVTGNLRRLWNTGLYIVEAEEVNMLSEVLFNIAKGQVGLWVCRSTPRQRKERMKSRTKEKTKEKTKEMGTLQNNSNI